MVNELVIIEKSTALDVFKSSDSVEDIISKVEREVNSFIPDVSTAKGRKEISSLAYKVAQSKTYLDGLGKDLVAELKEIPKLIDANRKAVRDRFDTLRDKVRQPLTEWEAEKERIEAEKQMLAWHEEALQMNVDFDKSLAERIESDHEIALLLNEKFDRDLVEAERLRIAHEDEIKRQAAEQARIEVEQKAQQEREAAELKAKQLAEEAASRERQLKEQAEREKLEAIKRAEQAAKDAEIRAENEKRQAIAAEQKKAADAEQARLAEVKRMADEEAKRQANVEHQREYNKESLSDLMSNGFDEETARKLIKAVINKEIRHISMNY